MAQEKDVDDIATSQGGHVVGAGEKKKDEAVAVVVDTEVGHVEKAYYSKTSVWLMVLYSALAIGSDG